MSTVRVYKVDDKQVRLSECELRATIDRKLSRKTVLPGFSPRYRRDLEEGKKEEKKKMDTSLLHNSALGLHRFFEQAALNLGQKWRPNTDGEGKKHRHNVETSDNCRKRGIEMYKRWRINEIHRRKRGIEILEAGVRALNVARIEGYRIWPIVK